MRRVLAAILISISFTTFSQEKIYWVNGYRYVYSALYMNEKGDTLSNEFILILPTDSVLNGNQTLLHYYFSRENEFLKARTDSILGFTTNWVDSVGEGALENGRLWIHPIRSNQYILTEMAPFPSAHFPLNEGNTWEAILKLPKVWGRFAGKIKSEYTVVGKEWREYGWGGEDCWKIESYGKHRRAGTSHLTTFFKEGFGFLEMNYVLFNGDKISFELVEQDISVSVNP